MNKHINSFQSAFLEHGLVWNQGETPSDVQVQVPKDEKRARYETLNRFDSLDPKLVEALVNVNETNADTFKDFVRKYEARNEAEKRVRVYNRFTSHLNQRNILRDVTAPVALYGYGKSEHPDVSPSMRTLDVSEVIDKLSTDIQTLEGMEKIYDSILNARPSGKDAYINGTKLSRLTKAEADQMLAKSPDEAAIWLRSNDRRNHLIGAMVNFEVANMGGKASQARNEMRLFTPNDAKQYRSMEPQEALTTLETLKVETERRIRKRADASLDAELSHF